MKRILVGLTAVIGLIWGLSGFYAVLYTAPPNGGVWEWYHFFMVLPLVTAVIALIIYGLWELGNSIMGDA